MGDPPSSFWPWAFPVGSPVCWLTQGESAGRCRLSRGAMLPSSVFAPAPWAGWLATASTSPEAGWHSLALLLLSGLALKAPASTASFTPRSHLWQNTWSAPSPLPCYWCWGSGCCQGDVSQPPARPPGKFFGKLNWRNSLPLLLFASPLSTISGRSAPAWLNALTSGHRWLPGCWAHRQPFFGLAIAAGPLHLPSLFLMITINRPAWKIERGVLAVGQPGSARAA